jgi:hypothetical protein
LEAGGYPLEFARQDGIAAAGLANKTRSSIFHFTVLLECFWSFYEAMRLGRPLLHADEKLAQMGSALRSIKHD